MNNMLSYEEVKNFLSLSNRELDKYIDQGRLNAYKVGGEFVRFRKEEVLALKDEVLSKTSPIRKKTFGSKLWDFWKFNNFYIIAFLIVVGMVYWFVRTYSSSV